MGAGWGAQAAHLAGDRRLGERLEPAGHLLGGDYVGRRRGVALEAAREDERLRPVDGRLEGQRRVDLPRGRGRLSGEALGVSGQWSEPGGWEGGGHCIYL